MPGNRRSKTWRLYVEEQREDTRTAKCWGKWPPRKGSEGNEARRPRERRKRGVGAHENPKRA